MATTIQFQRETQHRLSAETAVGSHYGQDISDGSCGPTITLPEGQNIIIVVSDDPAVGGLLITFKTQ